MKKISVTYQGQKNSDKTILLVCHVTGLVSEKLLGQNQLQLASGQSFSFTDMMEKYLYATVDTKLTKYEKYRALVFSTGISLPIKFWDTKTKQAIGERQDVNARLYALKQAVEKLYESLTLQEGNIITRELFKKNIDRYILNVSKPEPLPTVLKIVKEPEPEVKILTPLFSEYMTQRNDAEIKNKDIGKSQWKHNKTFINHWKNFEQHTNQQIYCQDLCTEVFEAFTTYFRELPSVTKESTIDKAKNTIKHFGLQAKEKYKLHDLTVSKNPKLRKKAGSEENNKPIIYLTVSELKALENLTSKQLSFLDAEEHNHKSGTKISHEVVRDYFLVAAWNGGKRFGDYNKFQLTERPDKPGKYFHDNISRKTGIYTKLSCFPVVVSIWKKYRKSKTKTIPALPTNQAYNRAIKQVCNIAGIKEEILIDADGKRESKWKTITSHSARKSFASNMVYEYNASRQKVAKWLGVSVSVLEKHYLGQDTRKAFEEFEEITG